MGANLENKKELVTQIAEQFKKAKSILFVDYRGITVAEDTVLRQDFRKENVSYKVYQHRLILRALQSLNVQGIDEKMFEGTTAVAFSEDEVAPARIFCDASSKLNKMEVKFGIVNGAILSKSEVESLAKVPSKPVLIAMLLGVLQGPISALARGLNEIAKKEA